MPIYNKQFEAAALAICLTEGKATALVLAFWGGALEILNSLTCSKQQSQRNILKCDMVTNIHSRFITCSNCSYIIRNKGLVKHWNNLGLSNSYWDSTSPTVNSTYEDWRCHSCDENWRHYWNVAEVEKEKLNISTNQARTSIKKFRTVTTDRAWFWMEKYLAGIVTLLPKMVPVLPLYVVIFLLVPLPILREVRHKVFVAEILYE